MSITLPPYQWGTFKDDSIELKVTQAQLRARDIEVARLVLEAAAQSAELWHANGIEVEIAREIRALEVKHE